MTMYRTSDVLLLRPDWVSDAQLGFRHSYDLLQDIGLGYHYSQYLETTFRFQAQWNFDNRTDLWTLLDFFDDKRGRGEAFWMPSWMTDVRITAAFGVDATSLTIEDIDYPTIWRSNKATGRHLYVEWPDGTYKLVGVKDSPSATQLTLSEAIGKACLAADLPGLFVCFLLFVRFDQDEMEIEYENIDVSQVKMSFYTVGGEGVTVTTTSSTTSSSSSTTTTTAPGQ